MESKNGGKVSRNQWIAREIEKETNKRLNRKQVSSHIQTFGRKKSGDLVGKY